VRLLSEVILETQSIEAGYKGIKVLWNVNVNVRRGEIVSILGPNGAGKSTLVKTIIGLIKPYSGKILFEGRDITNLQPFQRVKLGLSLVPDTRGLYPEMSVYENLLMGAYLEKSKNMVKKRIEEVYRLFPILKERSKQKARTLSGGEQQMLAIGKALMGNPKLIMLDEPTLGLSPRLSAEVINAISRLRSELGITILFIEEKIRYALKIADRIYVMDQGSIIYETDRTGFKAAEEILRKYVGG